MLENKYRQHLEEAGIQLNGANPWDPKVLDKRTYLRVFLQSSIGLGESYMSGWWDCEQLDEFFSRYIAHHIRPVVRKHHMINLLSYTKASFINLQKISRAFKVGEQHYNVGNNLYERMLDPYMNYSCGYWANATDLNQAQLDKMKLTCNKLKLEPKMKVLDIGCGWGGMAKFMAENYGVSVTGITVSSEQAKYARDFCKGLDVKIELTDYRSLTGHYDRVYSIGMFEHVGSKNYAIYMKKVSELIAEDSIFVLQTIGTRISCNNTDPWIEKYIFPNSMIPSYNQVTSATEKYFVIEDWHNLSTAYDKTLMAWHHNFNTAWNNIKHDYSAVFYRLWKYYLLSCAGGFRSRYNQLWQIVLSPTGTNGGYRLIR